MELVRKMGELKQEKEEDLTNSFPFVDLVSDDILKMALGLDLLKKVWGKNTI